MIAQNLTAHPVQGQARHLSLGSLAQLQLVALRRLAAVLRRSCDLAPALISREAAELGTGCSGLTRPVSARFFQPK